MTLNFRDTHLAGQSVQCPALRPQASLSEDKSDFHDPPLFYGNSIMDDLPAFKYYLSTWYHSTRATTKLTPAILYQRISSSAAHFHSVQLHKFNLKTFAQALKRQLHSLTRQTHCSFAHWKHYMQSLITSQVTKSSSSVTCY
jgi:hypothetical protein